jgi:hypothetical protein
MEIVELDQSLHPFYVAAQFHPEFKSRVMCPSPLFLGLLQVRRTRALFLLTHTIPITITITITIATHLLERALLICWCCRRRPASSPTPCQRGPSRRASAAPAVPADSWLKV